MAHDVSMNCPAALVLRCRPEAGAVTGLALTTAIAASQSSSGAGGPAGVTTGTGRSALCRAVGHPPSGSTNVLPRGPGKFISA